MIKLYRKYEGKKNTAYMIKVILKKTTYFHVINADDMLMVRVSWQP